MISCQKATEMMSRETDEPLSLKEELLLKLHLFICECCEQFRKQMEVLRSLARTSGERGDAKLSGDAKKRICDAAKNRSAE